MQILTTTLYYNIKFMGIYFVRKEKRHNTSIIIRSFFVGRVEATL